MTAKHFASLPGSELIRDLHERYIDFLAHRKGRFEPRWERNRQYYYNDHYGDVTGKNGVQLGGGKGELTLVSINHFRNLLQHLQNLIVGVKPVFDTRATNSDAKSLSQAKLANGLLDYYRSEKGLGDKLLYAVEEALIHDASYVGVFWDPGAGREWMVDENENVLNEGDIEFRQIMAYAVIFDHTRQSFKDNDWVMTFNMRSRWDLISQYPELERQILNAPTGDSENALPDSDRTGTDYKSDDVKVFEFYHKKTSSMPDGRFVMFLEGTVLYDDVLPYREIPIYQLQAGRSLTDQFGYSLANDLAPIQQMINSHYSAINSNHDAFGVQKVAVAKGSKISYQELTSNLGVIEYDGAAGPAPQGLNLVQTPPEMFNFVQSLEGVMETISGVNSVVRGKPESGVTSGTALALLQNQSIQFVNNFQASYTKLIEDVGTAAIRLLRDFAKSDRVVAIVGKGQAADMRNFNGDDLENVNRVQVDLGNPLTRTLAGKTELANQLVQTGLLQTPEQYLAVVTSGNLDALTEASVNEIQLIREENELLIEGKPTPVVITDDHRKHIMEHQSILYNPMNRNDEALMRVTLDHIQTHINMLQDPGAQTLFQVLGRQGLPPVNPAVNPSALQQPGNTGVQPGATPDNLPNPATPPGTAQPR